MRGVVLVWIFVLAGAALACRNADESSSYLTAHGMMKTVAFWRVFRQRVADFLPKVVEGCAWGCGGEISPRADPITVPTSDPHKVIHLGSMEGYVDHAWLDELDRALAAYDQRPACQDVLAEREEMFWRCHGVELAVGWIGNRYLQSTHLVRGQGSCGLDADTYESLRDYVRSVDAKPDDAIVQKIQDEEQAKFFRAVEV